jgi:regulator of protease activity HflC (stomatin/prohibitin superfamily)
MAFFEWLAQFLQEFIPPWEVVSKNYTAVRQRAIPLPATFKRWADKNGEGRFVRFLRWKVIGFVYAHAALVTVPWRVMPPDGLIIRDCGCGFVFKIPLLDRIDQVPVKYVSQDLENVEVETRSGKVYDLSPVLIWKGVNAIRAVTEVDDYEMSLKNAVRAACLRWANAQADTLLIEELEAASDRILKTSGGFNVGTEWGCYAKAVTANSCAPPWQVQELRHVIEGNPWKLAT